MSARGLSECRTTSCGSVLVREYRLALMVQCGTPRTEDKTLEWRIQKLAPGCYDDWEEGNLIALDLHSWLDGYHLVPSGGEHCRWRCLPGHVHCIW